MDTEGLTISKTFVYCTNFIFLMSGFALMSLGVLLLIDSERVLLSRLLGPGDSQTDQPLFYYLSFAIVGVGFVIATMGVIGCWATCLSNCIITTSYVIGIILLLMGKFTVCVVGVFWPQLLGLDLRGGKLVRALQRNYALPGHEQFTAALDFAQTVFSCCGVNGSSNYGTSWWRLQEVGRRDLVVPLTCCTLNNTQSLDAFLNPEPKNLQLCQSLNPIEHQRARHTAGCFDMIEQWTQNQALIFLAATLIVMLIEISALLSIILTSLKSTSKEKSQIANFISAQSLMKAPNIAESHRAFDSKAEDKIHMTDSTFGGKS